MRLAGIYFNDDEVLVLAERLKSLGLTEAGNRVTDAYYRDAREVDLAGVEPETLAPALEGGPVSFAALRAAMRECAADSLPS